MWQVLSWTIVLSPFWVPVSVACLLLMVGSSFTFGRAVVPGWFWWIRLLLLWLAAVLSVALVAYLRGTWSAWDVGEECAQRLDGWLWHDGSSVTETLWPVSSVCTAADGRSIELIPAFVTPTVAGLVAALPVLVVGTVRATVRRPHLRG